MRLETTPKVSTKDSWEGTKGGDTNSAEETVESIMLLLFPPEAVNCGVYK